MNRNYGEMLSTYNASTVISILLHIMFILFCYFGMPRINHDIEEIVISLDIVQVTNISNIKTQNEQKKIEDLEDNKSSKEVPVSQKKSEPVKDKKDLPNTLEKIEDKKPEIKEIIKEDNSKSEIIKEVKKEIKEEAKKKVEDKKEKPKDDVKKRCKLKKKKLDEEKGDFAELDSLLKTLEAPRIKNTDENVKKIG